MLKRHPLLAVLTVGYLAVVALLTLGPQPVGPTGTHVALRLIRFFGNHDLTSWIAYSRLEFLANIAMFVPIGVLALLLGGRRRWWLAVAFGVALTVVIELTQLGIPGRVTDIRDVIANSLGATIGVIFALAVTWRPVPHSTRPIPVIH